MGNIGANYKEVYAPIGTASGLNAQAGRYFSPGSRYYEEGVGEFVAVQNNSGVTIAQYDWVRIPNTYSAVDLTTAGAGAIPQTVGVVQAEGGIPNTYIGWVFVGKGGGLGVGIKANLALNCAANVALYTTATLGVADDAVTTRISNVAAVVGVTTAAAAEIFASDIMTVN